MNVECSAIDTVCKKLRNGLKPFITYIAVNKSHHTRLFPEHQRDECGRGKNVPTGTIVDSRIVSKSEKDFFLMSDSQTVDGLPSCKGHK